MSRSFKTRPPRRVTLFVALQYHHGHIAEILRDILTREAEIVEFSLPILLLTPIKGSRRMRFNDYNDLRNYVTSLRLKEIENLPITRHHTQLRGGRV